jgi:hypothetical protein
MRNPGGQQYRGADQQRGATTGRPVPWKGVFRYLASLADAKPDAADYAMAVRKVYDALVEDCGEAEEIRDGLVSLISAQQMLKRISREYRDLVVRLLPKPPRRGRGRPKDALGNKAYDKRYQLYLNWIREKALKPNLTKEQFAKEFLGITDEDLAGEREIEHRAKIEAVLQHLKPARMKQLDEGHRRAVETMYPLIVTRPMYMAQKWREAKERCPGITKENFLRKFFRWPRRKGGQHPIEAETVRDYLEILDVGEKRLADRGRELLTISDQRSRSALAKRKRSRRR